MADIEPLFSSFNGGEVSARMHARTDTAIYPIALETCENFIPTVEGPAIKRPGFRHIRAAAGTSTWLSAFVFNTTQAYVIEWAEAALRFYTNGGRIETGPSTPYSVAVPYSAAQAPFVSTQQSYDRLYMAHGDHPFAALTRTGAGTFAYAEAPLRNGPFADANADEAITVTVSATTGSITVTASAPIFLPGHVGGPFRIEAKDFSDVPAWEVGLDGIVVGDRRRSDGKVYEADEVPADSRTGSVQPVHVEGSEWDGSAVGEDVNEKGPYGIRWKYLYDRHGVGTITAVAGDGLSATVTVTRRLADSLVSIASHRWAHALFSEASGWPKHVAVWKGRLWLFRDFDIAASVVGDYGGGSPNFQQYTNSGGLAADLAIRHRLAAPDPILWVRADRQLIIGTASGEYALGPINPGDPISASNIDAVPQSFYGVSPVWPVQIAGATLFVQRGGNKIREAEYEFSRDRYVAALINRWARHILKTGVRQLAWQAEPEELLYAVREDGQLAVHPHAPEQEVKGWARIKLAANGRILSAVSTPGEAGPDELWTLVERGGVKSVEQQAPFWVENETALDDAEFLDSAASISFAEPTISVPPFVPHLAGREVMVLADGAVVPGRSINGAGAITPPLDIPARKVTVGLGYECRAKRLKPEMRGRDGGTAQGKRKRIVGVIIRLLETCGLMIDPGTGDRDDLIDRPGSGQMDHPIPPFTGDTDSKTVGGNWGRDAQYELISHDPLPCIVLGEMPRYSVEGGQ